MLQQGLKMPVVEGHPPRPAVPLHLYRLRSASGALLFACASLVLFRYSLLKP